MVKEWHNDGKDIKPLLKELVDYNKRIWSMENLAKEKKREYIAILWKCLFYDERIHLVAILCLVYAILIEISCWFVID